MKESDKERIYLDLVNKAFRSKHGLDIFAVLIKDSFSLSRISSILKTEPRKLEKSIKKLLHAFMIEQTIGEDDESIYGLSKVGRQYWNYASDLLEKYG